MPQNFTNAKIYKITNDYNDDVYIGSTCNTLIKRFSEHKQKCKTEMHLPLYKLMNEIGTERFRIDLLEAWEAIDKQDITIKEAKYIRVYSTLNKMLLNGKVMTPSERKQNQRNKEKEILGIEEYHKKEAERMRFLRADKRLQPFLYNF